MQIDVGVQTKPHIGFPVGGSGGEGVNVVGCLEDKWIFTCAFAPGIGVAATLNDFHKAVDRLTVALCAGNESESGELFKLRVGELVESLDVSHFKSVGASAALHFKGGAEGAGPVCDRFLCGSEDGPRVTIHV